jgi:ArsR family transcriptional regulator
MGELIAGTPALRLRAAVSLPLDLVSLLSLLYRAVPGSGLDPWLIAARASLPAALRHDLDLLHGFSGRLLYYMEEPVMRFEPLRRERSEAGADDLLAFLEALPAPAYRGMAAHALARVHRDLGLPPVAPDVAGHEEATWRAALEPALTTASLDEAWSVIANPELLKARTVALYRGVWERVYRAEYAAQRPLLEAAQTAAEATIGRSFEPAFSDLTGNRPPEALAERLGEVRAVTFCPSAHLRNFVSYILYPPDLVVFFGAPELLQRLGERPDGAPAPSAEVAVADEALLEGLRALADPTRLRIVDLLGEGELYAQEIVGRLGLAQSAISRHLAQLERAGVVAVEARRGSKYYRVNGERLGLVADGLRRRAR